MDRIRIRSWTGHKYYCFDCKQTWKAYDRFHLWPIRIMWEKKSKDKFFAWGGWQVGLGKFVGERRFGQTVRIGRLLIILGPSIKKLKPYNREEYFADCRRKVRHFACKHCMIQISNI